MSPTCSARKPRRAVFFRKRRRRLRLLLLYAPKRRRSGVSACSAEQLLRQPPAVRFRLRQLRPAGSRRHIGNANSLAGGVPHSAGAVAFRPFAAFIRRFPARQRHLPRCAGCSVLCGVLLRSGGAHVRRSKASAQRLLLRAPKLAASLQRAFQVVQSVFPSFMRAKRAMSNPAFIPAAASCSGAPHTVQCICSAR